MAVGFVNDLSECLGLVFAAVGFVDVRSECFSLPFEEVGSKGFRFLSAVVGSRVFIFLRSRFDHYENTDMTGYNFFFFGFRTLKGTVKMS